MPRRLREWLPGQQTLPYPPLALMCLNGILNPCPPALSVAAGQAKIEAGEAFSAGLPRAHLFPPSFQIMLRPAIIFPGILAQFMNFLKDLGSLSASALE
uniref:Uncharacterized protein n=1 Tax=Prolemur simus TaxID=1328070 RepID=A0A8C9B6V4_PROSS